MLSDEERRQVLARARAAISHAEKTCEETAVVHRRIHRDRDAAQRSIAAVRASSRRDVDRPLDAEPS
jgi:hypothetical protein